MVSNMCHSVRVRNDGALFLVSKKIFYLRTTMESGTGYSVTPDRTRAKRDVGLPSATFGTSPSTSTCINTGTYLVPKWKIVAVLLIWILLLFTGYEVPVNILVIYQYAVQRI